MSEKLLRFVSAAVDSDSDHAVGVFQVLRELEGSHALSAQERDRVEELRSWFNNHLERPLRFSKSQRPHRHRKAISWFRSSAAAHIARMRELSQILQQHGYVVRQLETARPGYVVYEDDHQVTAIPFVDDQIP